MKHPNLQWEVCSVDGRLVSCLLAPCALAHAVVQYVDEMVSDVEEFDDLNAARERVRLLYADTARDAGPARTDSRRPDACHEQTAATREVKRRRKKS